MCTLAHHFFFTNTWVHCFSYFDFASAFVQVLGLLYLCFPPSFISKVSMIYPIIQFPCRIYFPCGVFVHIADSLVYIVDCLLHVVGFLILVLISFLTLLHSLFVSSLRSLVIFTRSVWDLCLALSLFLYRWPLQLAGSLGRVTTLSSFSCFLYFCMIHDLDSCF